MSEHAPHSPEHKHQGEALTSPEHHEVAEKLHHKHEVETIQPESSIEAIQRKVEAAAKSTHETPVEDKREKRHGQYFVNRELKATAFQRTMVRVRKQLGSGDRMLSKVVHQPIVDAVSNIGAKTIARPAGIVTGGLMALLGSTVLLYMAKHYGFSYNLSLFFLLLIGGYLVGIGFELLMYLSRKLRQS